MIYKVRAKFKAKKAEEFLQRLTDGAIQKQRPDGPEIVASMHRATIDESGLINWTELCYCPSPLKHERATVLDRYFSEMETETIESHTVFEGKPFMDHLARS